MKSGQFPTACSNLHRFCAFAFHSETQTTPSSNAVIPCDDVFQTRVSAKKTLFQKSHGRPSGFCQTGLSLYPWCYPELPLGKSCLRIVRGPRRSAIPRELGDEDLPNISHFLGYEECDSFFLVILEGLLLKMLPIFPRNSLRSESSQQLCTSFCAKLRCLGSGWVLLPPSSGGWPQPVSCVA